MIRPPPRSTRTDTLFPYTTLFRSVIAIGAAAFAWSGLYNIAADDQHTRPVYAMLTTFRERSIAARVKDLQLPDRSEEHTSELQSLMRISYAVFCLKKKNT